MQQYESKHNIKQISRDTIAAQTIWSHLYELHQYPEDIAS